MAITRLGWSESTFWDSSLRAFILGIRGRDAADKYAENKLNFLVRNHAFVLARVGGFKKDSPTDLWPHPWDDGLNVSPRVTQEDIERLNEAFRKFDEMENAENGISRP